MGDISRLTGREYHPFVYYGAPDADRVIVAMGSVTETVRETVDYLTARGEKVGLLTVHLYRPFSAKYFFDQLPSTVKKDGRPRPDQGAGGDRGAPLSRCGEPLQRTRRLSRHRRGAVRPELQGRDSAADHGGVRKPAPAGSQKRLYHRHRRRRHPHVAPAARRRRHGP